MKPHDLPPVTGWTLAPRRAHESLRDPRDPQGHRAAGHHQLRRRPASPRTFPVDAFAQACPAVLRADGPGALQYAASEGYGPLREAVAAMLPWAVDPAQVLITTGSQQGLDLVGKVLIDSGSRALVETPTYLGALQAFAPMEPEVVGVASDAEGVDLADLAARRDGARFLATFCPTSRTPPAAR